MAETPVDQHNPPIFNVPESGFYPRGLVLSREDREMINRKIDENKIEQTGLNAKAIQLAAEEIRSIQLELGLKVTEGGMETAYVSPHVFEEIADQVSKGTARKGRSGGYFPALNSIVFADENALAYLVGSHNAHELLHKEIDAKAMIKTNTREPYAIRAGLVVVNHYKSKYGGRDQDTKGAMLNELGNYLMQQKFAEKLLKDTDFAEDKQIRDTALKDIPIRDGYYKVSVQVGDKESVSIRLSEENLHPSDGRKIVMGPALFYTQLSTDLEKVCDKGKEPGTFRKALLFAKAFPAKQNELRTLVDEAMGEGFYSDLKNAKYEFGETLVDLLVEVQNVAYGTAHHKKLT